jgi:dihydroorotase
VTLERRDWKVPESLAFGADRLVPLRAGETLPWTLA